MINKETRREMKKNNKRILIFLCIAFPVLLVLTSLLYTLVPSLLNNQWIVIMLIVAVGGFIYLLVGVVMKKIEKKKAEKPKKHDPFAD